MGGLLVTMAGERSVFRVWLEFWAGEFVDVVFGGQARYRKFAGGRA